MANEVALRTLRNSILGDEAPRLIVSRRAIASGLAALMAAPVAASAKSLKRLSNIPIEFDASSFQGITGDGLFLPDYRFPMCRLVFDTGKTTLWHKYNAKKFTGGNPVAIEVCAPDKNGMPRYTQLEIAS